MNGSQLKIQSMNAYQQNCIAWRENAKVNGRHPQKSFEELSLIGVGRAIVACANGFSFEEAMPLLIKYAGNVDFIACDKTLGHLLKNGIKPKFCLVADARVSYEKYLEPYKDQLSETILLQNVCGNPKWADNGNWKDKYFFVYMDVMHYEREFQAISKCPNLITAGTNVSNMMVVALTQCTNENRRNLIGYDKIILTGFDYSWRMGGKYYAFDQDAGGKQFYMRHIYGLSPSGKMIYSSNNLNASAQWLNQYCEAFRVPVVQTTKDGLATFGKVGDLEAQLKYRYKTTDLDEIRKEMKKKNHLATQLKKIDNKLRDISKTHYYAHLATV